ncbi:sodium- and chloride-dependent glycine transporter 2-like [Mercenaria mercenaria]|uniref:sodium- and chloride-dependent glycine transporter 2-like n=1 Tax=Mercenaria mercenaria TaxID=6596 RepID=UPI00234ED89B|nr:sodium- and chloride-dependent glycine transporter 2-like [Mercenaria mercenaria]
MLNEDNISLSQCVVSQNEKREKYKFASTFSSYITQLGHSLGMSDFWRFPFLAYRNGGGAFLIPFVTMIVVCGIPMYFLEFSIGKFSGRGPYKVWDICPFFRGAGITVSLAYGIYIVSSSIYRCWIMQFIVYAFQDPIPWSQCGNDWNTRACEGRNNTSTELPAYWNLTHENGTLESNASAPTTKLFMSASEEFWQYKVLQLSTGIWDLSPVIWRYFLFLFILRAAVCLCTIKSIKSIEKVIYVTATFPVLMSVAIFIRSIMLPGYQDGIYYFFNPKFDKLLDVRVWIEATLMAFYTLSFGWGAIVLLGSHADFKENSLRTAVIVPIIDMCMAVFNGMVCFCILGNMAHAYDVHITEVIHAGMATGMVAYVTALSSFPVPQLWSVLFLVSILFTGIDGQLLALEMIMQCIGDVFHRVKTGYRIKTLIVVSSFMFLLSLPTCTGSGGYLFLWLDWYNGAWFGPIVAFVELFVVAWIYGLDRFNDDIYLMIGKRIPGILRIGLAFVSPIVVAVIFFTSLVEYVPPKYGSYSYPTLARILGWLLVVAVMTPIIGQAVYIVRQRDGPLCRDST